MRQPLLSSARFSALFALVLATFGLSAAAQPDFGFGAPADRVDVSAELSSATARPGDQLVVAVVLDHDEGWHAWPRAPREGEADVLPEGFDFAIRTEIRVDDTPAQLSLGPIQWPDTYLAKVANPAGGPPVEAPTYSGRAIAYIPILIADDAEPGELSVPVSVTWQACDDTTCEMPKDKTIELALTIGEQAAAAATGEDFAGFDASVYAEMAAGTVAQAPAESTGSGRSFLGFEMPEATGFVGVLITALLAAIGGLVLNLTPCVLPVIPIKVMTISQHAGSPGKSFILGLWMAIGVVAFWFGIGLPVALFAEFTDPSRLFGIWWVTAGIGVLIAAMGVGIMGFFNINLPKQVYMVNPKADSAWGSFMFGVMTAVLGLPCFGFVAGALLAGAATMPPAIILTIFFALGLGMASPYLVLSAKPGWVEKIPRTGPASELVKQVMGLLLLAAAAYFIGSGAIALAKDGGGALPWWGTTIHWWFVALFGLAAGVWLFVRTVQITKKVIPRTAFLAIGLVLAATPVAYAADITGKARENFWVAFDQAELDAAVADGKVVVIDFTAEWCLNCKALKAAVLTRQPVKGELLSGSVVPMTADLTSTKAPGWDKLRDLGRTGIPLLAVYGPGLDEPWLSNAYTTDQVMSAIERARGR